MASVFLLSNGGKTKFGYIFLAQSRVSAADFDNFAAKKFILVHILLFYDTVRR